MCLRKPGPLIGVHFQVTPTIMVNIKKFWFVVLISQVITGVEFVFTSVYFVFYCLIARTKLLVFNDIINKLTQLSNCKLTSVV